MAVTYNWSYRPGVANKYGIVIPASTDDVRPAGVYYVAHWGNDITGNGSRIKPYKTIAKVNPLIANNDVIVLASGTYRETPGATTQRGTVTFVGDGNVICDGTALGGTPFSTHFDSKVLNIVFKNYLNLNGTFQNSYMDCEFNNFTGLSLGNSLRNLYHFIGCVFKNCPYIYGPVNLSTVNDFKNCTFYRCLNIQFTNSSGLDTFNSCIFYLCNINFSAAQQLNYSLFYKCNVRFNATAPTTPTVYYPSTPTGYSKVDTITDLRTAHISAFPAAVINFPNCVVADPLFNNEAIEDLSIGTNSPARNLSYFGTFVGAYSITKALAVKSSELVSAFDNSSAVNLNIADNALTLLDVEANASIVTKPIDNTAGRELQRLHTFGINADRNGEYVDSTADLANTTISAGTTLSVSTPYVVEVGAITYDGNVYNAGQRFTSKSSSPGTFTTSTSGVLREILEAPARENVEARFSDGALTTVDNTATLEELAWYFVEGNAVTYNGNSYAVGAFLKVLTGITSFTGTGLLRKVFSDSDTYFYFEINQKPTSNNVGNSRTGAIVRGNGDKDFDRIAANIFPINKKFIQLRYTIQVNNLTP